MFEYAKSVLQRVSFNPELFRKEYKKMIGWVLPEEQKQLQDWCKTNYNYPQNAVNKPQAEEQLAI